MSTYIIQISEPWDFEQPDGTNCIRVKGVGSMCYYGLNKRRILAWLFSLDVPIEYGGELVKQVICSPRYTGVSLESMMRDGCSVGISRVKPGVSVRDGVPMELTDLAYFAIGTIAAA